MQEIRSDVMALMNKLEAEYKTCEDVRVKKALKRALANLNRLFGILLLA